VTKSVKTANMSLSTLKKHLFGVLDTVLDDGEYESSLQHIAMVCQGAVTRDGRGLLWSPITKLKNIDLGGILQQRYGVSVSVSNNCNMIALAIFDERQSDSQRANENFAVVLSSFGIGFSYFHQGDILTGSHSSGTEFGHMSDEPSDLVPQDELMDLVTAAHENPGPARDAFEDAGAAIGQGLANLFALFDPFPAILVGITPDAFSLMEKTLHNDLQHYGVHAGDGTVSVYDRATERKLVRSGALLQSLSYIDEKIFGFGGNALVGESVV